MNLFNFFVFFTLFSNYYSFENELNETVQTNQTNQLNESDLNFPSNPNDLFFSESVQSDKLNGTVFCLNPGTVSEECSYNGICTNEGTCDCDDGYTTHPKNSNRACNYKQKSRVTAFLFSFFLGVESGAGEWYLGNTDLALGQLFLTWLGCGFICIATCIISIICQKKSEGEISCLTSSLGFLWLIGVVIWWFCDWILIVKGKIQDKNGVDTYDDF